MTSPRRTHSCTSVPLFVGSKQESTTAACPIIFITMAADVLGIISGGLGIISFILGQTPDSNDGPSVSVELTVGYASNPNTGEQLDSPGGKFGHVYLFSPQNEQIGDKDIGGHNVGAGVSYQFDVDTTGEQPEYLEVTATNDAVCMSWMAVTYGSDVASGTYAFFGDFFDYCGLGGLEVSEHTPRHMESH